MIAACPFPAARGTPARIYRLADELGERGHQVHVFTYHLGGDPADAKFEIRRIADIRTYRKESPGPSVQKLLVLDSLLAVKLLQAVRHRRYDIIHAHHVEGLLAALPAHWLTGIPLVFDVHTLVENELPFYRMALSPWLLRRLGRGLDRYLPRFADHVVAVSSDIQRELIERHGISARNIAVIPNGVEDDFLAPPSGFAGAPKEGERSQPILVFAGNLAPYQRFELLLQAVALARKHRPGIRLLVITDSSFDGYRALASQLDLQDHLEIVSVSLGDLPKRLVESDIALNPRTECVGLPQKLLNYMAAGRPIVSFAGSARYLEHEQRALIVEDEDVAGFAEAIVRLVDDPALAHRLGQAGRAFVAEHLSWTRTAIAAEAVYERLRSRSERGSIS
jgi:glycosyltransferase involved in cell wall biosynthesis